MVNPKGRLYIASSLLNRDRVQALRDHLARECGVELTYDWSVHGYVEGEAARSEIAGLEAEGVCRAECVLLVMPGRNGSHFEVGMAFALQIPIVVLAEDESLLQTSFHWRPELLKCHSERDAISAVLEILRDGPSCGRRAGQPVHLMQELSRNASNHR